LAVFWPAEEWLFVLLLWLFVLLLPDAEPALARGLLFSPEAACLPPVRCWAAAVLLSFLPRVRAVVDDCFILNFFRAE
jgi:hypothetical protein